MAGMEQLSVPFSGLVIFSGQVGMTGSNIISEFRSREFASLGHGRTRPGLKAFKDLWSSVVLSLEQGLTNDDQI